MPDLTATDAAGKREEREGEKKVCIIKAVLRRVGRGEDRLLPSSSLLFDFPKLIDSERSVGRWVPPRPEFCRIGEKRERGRKRRGGSCKLPVFEDSPNKMRTSRLQGSEVRFYFRRTFKKLKIYRKQNLAKFLIAVDPSPSFRLPFNSPSPPPPPFRLNHARK